MGFNSASRGYVVSIYPEDVLGLLTKTQDGLWHFFQKFTWNTYELKHARGTLGYPAHG